MKKLSLIIEKSKDGKLWGRVKFNNDLIVDAAVSTDELEKKMKKLLQRFHQVEPSEIRFELAYDLTALFSQKDFLNISAIALKAGISPGLMRQYVAGLKYPSSERAKVIEHIVNGLGRELIKIKVVVVKNEPASKVIPAKKLTLAEGKKLADRLIDKWAKEKEPFLNPQSKKFPGSHCI